MSKVEKRVSVRVKPARATKSPGKPKRVADTRKAKRRGGGLSVLFREGKIGGLTVKNRLVMPPMVRNYADDEGRVTDRYVAHIAKVAAGGVGTIILEASYVRPDGKGFANQLGIHDDTVVTGLNKLARAAHDSGAAIGVQIYHGGRQASEAVSGFKPVAPSAIPDPTVKETPKMLSVSDISNLVKAFGDAADRAQRAGLDFVEIHGAHGYLITQFLSPFSNKRRDGYGGTAEKRMRFLLEVYAEVRRRVGPDFPVILRLSGDEFVRGGLTVADTVRISKRMEKEGIAAIHVSASNYASYNQGLLIPPMAVPDGPLVKLAAQVKKSLKTTPVIAVAKIRHPEMAAKLLRDGRADFIAVGRSLLADPEWPNKAKSGRVKDIRPCIACNQGCITRLFEQRDVRCTVNPETGFEREFHGKAAKSLRVLVVGAGPAGLTAAIVAAERGHKVTLIEKSRKLGGQLSAAAAAPYRKDWEVYREWLIRRVRQLGVNIRTNEPFSVERARTETPDALIIAVGSSSARPSIPGSDLPHVIGARELLDGAVKPQGKVVLAGGGCMGAQTAEYLLDLGHKVTLVEATGELAVEAPSADRALLLSRLSRMKLKVKTNTLVKEIRAKSVIVDGPNGEEALPADTVVLCLGATPNDITVADMEGIAAKTLVVGDAIEPRRVTEAVREAADAVLSL